MKPLFYGQEPERKKLRVAAYCRVSTDKEDQANSFENQQRYFQSCIAQNPDWELQAIYADEGLSGTSTKRRTQFNRMISAALSGEIDLIITKEVSRFARNTLDTLEYTRKLHRHGVGVVFLIDNIDTRQQDGELRLTLMSSLAQEESRKTSQRVKWGQTRQMERGVVFGRSLLGYDVADGKITVNPAGAETVRLIFHSYLVARKGAHTIARELRESGRTTSRGNCNWSSATVLKILKNEKYCGDLVQKKTYTPDYLTHEKKYNDGQEPYVILRDHHEPIIDRQTWEATQEEIKRRQRGSSLHNGSGNRYPLSGKILCGACGSCFHARTKTNSKGQLYRVWRCGRATQEGASKNGRGDGKIGCAIGRQIRDDVALEMVRRAVQSVELDREDMICRLTRVVHSVLQGASDRKPAQPERMGSSLKTLRQRKAILLDAFEQQAITKEDYDFFSQCLDAYITKTTACQARPIGESENCNERQQDEIANILREVILKGTEDPNFYVHFLDNMVVYADGTVEVALRNLSYRWVFQQ